MRERIRQVCGTLALDSTPGRGTRVEARAPTMLAGALSETSQIEG
jgi:hypothetical protein